MAATLNKACLIGNLTRKPEVRKLPNGQAVCAFKIAINRDYKSQNGERKNEVSFISVVAWGKRGEWIGTLEKGGCVYVEGCVQSRSWTATDGTKRSALEVIAESVQLLPQKNIEKTSCQV